MRFFLVGLLLVSSAQAHVLVGNGGEGIKAGEKIYLRDLFEYGVNLQTRFGTKREDLIAKEVKSWNGLELSRDQQDLLIRKLTDADEVYPHFGYYLIQAIKFYQWTLVDQPLSLLPETFAQVHYDDSLRVQIASRYQSTILVHRESFAKLDDTNRVALILHEAIYALAKKIHTGSPGASPEEVNLGATKIIVSNLFSQMVQNPETEIEMIGKNLRVPPATQQLSFQKSLALSLNGIDPSQPDEATSISDGQNNQRRFKFIDSFCRQLASGGVFTPVIIDAYQPSVRLSASHSESQVSLSVEAREAHIYESVAVTDCDGLHTVVDSFYEN